MSAAVNFGGLGLPLANRHAPYHFLAQKRDRHRVESYSPHRQRSAQRIVTIWILTLILFLGFPAPGDAYSVLSHEAIIDAVWITHIVPLLKKRFPQATPDE